MPKKKTLSKSAPPTFKRENIRHKYYWVVRNYKGKVIEKIPYKREDYRDIIRQRLKNLKTLQPLVAPTPTISTWTGKRYKVTKPKVSTQAKTARIFSNVTEYNDARGLNSYHAKGRYEYWVKYQDGRGALFLASSGSVHGNTSLKTAREKAIQNIYYQLGNIKFNRETKEEYREESIKEGIKIFNRQQFTILEEGTRYYVHK